MPKTPHKDKLLAAIENPKCQADVLLLKEALQAYQIWVANLNSLQNKGKERVFEMVKLLNEYKDFVEVDLIATKGTDFIKRQKGQLKLDNSILEEFLIYLLSPDILDNLPKYNLETGTQTAFMSLSFMPNNVNELGNKPNVIIKTKDQDFTIGKTVHYKFSSDSSFDKTKTTEGNLFLAVFATECKINYDKTMFQECAATAQRLKQGCPIAKYFALVEYLDMTPEDCRLTEIDNVFLIRHAKRLPFEKRNNLEEVRKQHQNFPISNEVIWNYVQEIQLFINAVWYDPEQALKRGSFI